MIPYFLTAAVKTIVGDGYSMLLVLIGLAFIGFGAYKGVQYQLVIKAENDKQSTIDFANARETKADGERRASIKEVEGKSQAIERVADARAKEIQMINESAEKYFIGNAKDLKKLEVIQSSLENNSKIVLTEKGVSTTLVLNETGEKIIPTSKSSEEYKEK